MTELPTPLVIYSPERVRKLGFTDLLKMYRLLYKEYVSMCEAHSRAGDHAYSVEKHLTEVLVEADHWHKQYYLLFNKNRHLQLPTKKERMEGSPKRVI